MAKYVFPVAGKCQFDDTHWDSNGNGKPDLAVDIFAAKGTPLVAVTDGKSVIQDFKDGGHTAMLFGDDGRVYYYAHMVQGSGVPGRLAAGQRIGAVDNTGNAATTPSHCHWAMATQAFGIDNFGQGDLAPWPFLRKLQANVPPKEDELTALEKQELGDLRNLVGNIQGPWIAAARSAIVDAKTDDDTPSRNAKLDAALAACATIQRGG